MASKSAFSAILRKELGDSALTDTQNFEDYKKVAKTWATETRGHLLAYFARNERKLVIFDVNT